jgi:hypothetical protein
MSTEDGQQSLFDVAASAQEQADDLAGSCEVWLKDPDPLHERQQSKKHGDILPPQLTEEQKTRGRRLFGID